MALQVPPLFAHGSCNSLECNRPVPTSVRPGCHAVNAVIPTLYNVCRFQFRQVLEPEAGCFRFPMPELPRLDDLIGFPIMG